MDRTTLCLLLQDDRVLLAMKKRGFGQGKWNGIGGKLNEGESIHDAALRELMEEIGVSASREDLRRAGYIEFFFDGRSLWDQDMTIFLVNHWSGEPCETEEMKPCWFHFKDIPYEEMWVGDKHWMPVVLEGKTIRGKFFFNADGSQLNDYTIEMI